LFEKWTETGLFAGPKREQKMPKGKTRKAAAKRFKKTAKGKIKYSKAGTGHLLGGKTRKRKRKLRAAGILSAAEEKRVTKMLST